MLSFFARAFYETSRIPESEAERQDLVIFPRLKMNWAGGRGLADIDKDFQSPSKRQRQHGMGEGVPRTNPEKRSVGMRQHA